MEDHEKPGATDDMETKVLVEKKSALRDLSKQHAEMWSMKYCEINGTELPMR